MIKTIEQLGEVSKNSREKVLVSKVECYGDIYIDIRIFWPDETGEYRPSRQGICIKPEIAATISNFLKEV